MATRDLPDIYARALGPAALGLGHIYQANPSWPWYNYYIYLHVTAAVDIFLKPLYLYIRSYCWSINCFLCQDGFYLGFIIKYE